MIDSVQHEIQRHVDEGDPLERTYDEVVREQFGLSEEQRSAIWLYTWHCCERDAAIVNAAAPPELALA